MDLTKTMKSKSDFIMKAFKFNLKLPQFYEPDTALVETLNFCIENKQQNPSNLKQVSQQLSKGMDRNQFSTNY